MGKLDEKIKYRLYKINVNYDELKPTIKKYLDKIEFFITDIEIRKNNLETELRDLTKNKPNLLSVSNGAKISRQTLYNNEILKNYIETASDDIFVANPNEKIIEDLQKKVASLNTIIEKLQIRDFESQILIQENQKLRELLSNSQTNTELLRSQKEEAQKRLRELEKTSSSFNKNKTNSEVINIAFKD